MAQRLGPPVKMPIVVLYPVKKKITFPTDEQRKHWARLCSSSADTSCPERLAVLCARRYYYHSPFTRRAGGGSRPQLICADALLCSQSRPASPVATSRAPAGYKGPAPNPVDSLCPRAPRRRAYKAFAPPPPPPPVFVASFLTSIGPRFTSIRSSVASLLGIGVVATTRGTFTACFPQGRSDPAACGDRESSRWGARRAVTRPG
jgi:hypothetical protein